MWTLTGSGSRHVGQDLEGSGLHAGAAALPVQVRVPHSPINRGRAVDRRLPGGGDTASTDRGRQSRPDPEPLSPGLGRCAHMSPTHNLANTVTSSIKEQRRERSLC